MTDRSKWRWAGGYLTQYVALLTVLGLLILVFGTMTDSFFATPTLLSIANQIPALMVVAVGMTLVLIVGGIDLSVGSLLALSSSVLAVLMKEHGWPLWLATLACIGACAGCGLINGMITAIGKIPSFIVTLGMLEIARGLAKIVSDSRSLFIGSDVGWIGEASPFFGISPAFLFAIGVVLIGQFVLSHTVFGRYCVAIGTNEEAVRMSGIDSKVYVMAVFAISGLLCAVAGIMATSLMSTGNPNLAVGFELSAIAACVVGGTSLMGGRGSVIASFLGVLIISVLQTGLATLSVPDPMKQVITGCVIIGAVVLDVVRQKWSR